MSLLGKCEQPSHGKNDKARPEGEAKEDESPYMPKFCDVCNEWFRNPDTFDAHLGMRGHRKRSEATSMVCG